MDKVVEVEDTRGSGQRIADAIVNTLGSWPFILIQTTLLLIWIAFNGIAWFNHWDPYPFIALNLLLSCQAAYATPLVMMSQNRQAEKDRATAERDLASDLRSERTLEHLEEQERILMANLDIIINVLLYLKTHAEEQKQVNDVRQHTVINTLLQQSATLEEVKHLAEIRRRRYRSKYPVAERVPDEVEVLPTNVYPLRHQDESQEV